MVDEATAKQAKVHAPASLDETAYLPFSSGTTGLPKAVEISHNNVINMVEIFHHSPSIFPRNDDGSQAQFRALNFLPFFHAYALILMLHYPIRKRGHTSILRPFQPEAYCRLVKELKVNFLALVPPVLTLLTKHPDATKDAFASVTHSMCGAAPLDFETQSAFTRKTGVAVNQAFGMTETTVGALGLQGTKRRVRSAVSGLPPRHASAMWRRARTLGLASGVSCSSAALKCARATTATRRPHERRSLRMAICAPVILPSSIHARASSASSTGSKSSSSTKASRWHLPSSKAC